MIKTIIIDDEAPARNNLKQIIKDNFNDILITGEADSVKTGIVLLNKTTPDLVFLDINLSDGNGFNILEMIENISFQIIFITAYDEYAIKAFQFNALDYILKPIEIHHLEKALKKVKEMLQHNYITQNELNFILDNYSKKDEDKKLAIHEANKITFASLNDIMWCKADGNYTVFFFLDGSSKLTSKTLKMIELQLPESMFYRTHQSSIINLNYVKEYNKEDGGYIVLSDNTKVNIARRRKEDFLNKLKKR